MTSVTVGDNKVLRCRADASPAPHYSWLHRRKARPGQDTEDTVEVVARTEDLELSDLGYLEAGEYRCRADNTIGDEERSTESEVIRLEVSSTLLTV